MWDDEKVLEMDGGDGSTALGMSPVPLNCTLRNGQNGKFCVRHVL